MRVTKRHIAIAAPVVVAACWLLSRADVMPAGVPATSGASRGSAPTGAPWLASPGIAAPPGGTAAVASPKGAGAPLAEAARDTDATAPVALAAPDGGALAALAASPASTRWRAERVDATWSLAQVKVVSPGTTVEIPADPKSGQPAGILTEGYVLEGKVRAADDGILPDGDFRLTLTAFRPDVDVAGQKAGLWHVQGRWKVVARDADPAALKARHNPYVIEGRIQDALPFNPAETDGAWSARATVPTSPAAGRWARSRRGTLTLRPGGGGDLEIDLALLGGNR